MKTARRVIMHAGMNLRVKHNNVSGIHHRCFVD